MSCLDTLCRMCVTLLSDGSKPELLIQYGLLENECGKMLHTASETNLV